MHTYTKAEIWRYQMNISINGGQIKNIGIGIP